MRRIFCLIAVITAVFALGLTASADTLYGDVDSNGSVEPVDAVVLSRHLAAWTGYETLENPENADLDQDGKVNTLDVMILMRHFAGWKGYLDLPYGEHTPGKAVRENEVIGTCKVQGTYDEVVYCSVCGEELSRTQKTSNYGEHKLGAAVRENEVPGTCEVQGTYDEVVYCSVCGEELSRTKKTSSYGEHKPGKAVIENEVEGTCEVQGTYDEVVYCSVCGEELSRTQKTSNYGEHKPGKAVIENEVEGTCEVAGTYDEVVYCSVCGEELSRTRKTSGYGDHKPGTAMMTHRPGENCKVYGTWVEVVGCAVCGEELSQTERPSALFGPHNYVGGSCTECGKVDESITEPTFVVGNVSANAGDTGVEVAVKVVKNPGILGMTMKLEYDDSVMTLVEAENGEAFAPLKMTPPKKYKSGCNFVWYADDLADEDVVDGDILVLTFDVLENAASGTYPVTVKYTDGNIFDVNLDPISVDIKNGVFTISGDTGNDEPDEPVVPDEPEITEPTFVVTKVSANAGDTGVEVAVKVVKNPGILGMTMKLEYDASVLTLVEAENGEAFAPLKMTPPKTYKSGCNFVWYADDLADEDVVDGNILVLTFEVSADAADGSYPVIIKYTDGSIFDVNLDSINLDIINGEITVK